MNTRDDYLFRIYIYVLGKARLSKITADGSDTDPSDSAQWPWSGSLEIETDY